MYSHGNHLNEADHAELDLGADQEAHIGIAIPSAQNKAEEPGECLSRRVILRGWFKKLWLSPAFSFLQRSTDGQAQFPNSPSVPDNTQQRFHIHAIRKFNWASVMDACKEWIQHPAHVALLVWSVCVVVSASMLGLLLLGILDQAFPRKSLRNQWIEINNQVLNALFTLMSLYQHPVLFHHFVLLCRWRPDDIEELRRVYCKNGTCRPREQFHMSVVVTLLHITCFAQYVLCGLYWVYLHSDRPEFAENFFAVLGTAAPILAGLYTNYSPLRKEYDTGTDKEPEDQPDSVTAELNERRIMVTMPEWAGGLCDCGDDTTVGCLSFFCVFCVFGWNMERLGFGNMYVHIATFILLCFAPFWIFNIAALHIHDKVIGDMIGTAGIVVCAFGLLYGGFWRIQMRKKYGLPGNNQCCGSASAADYIQWMFCWSCSLAQEVRTGDFYDVEDSGMCRKNSSAEEECHAFLLPLPRESRLKSVPDSVNLPNYVTRREDCVDRDRRSLLLQEETYISSDEATKPPAPPSIESRESSS